MANIFSLLSPSLLSLRISLSLGLFLSLSDLLNPEKIKEYSFFKLTITDLLEKVA